MVQSIKPVTPQAGHQPVRVADLRDIPLDQLVADDDAHRLVSMTVNGQDDSSHSQVSQFNSSI